MNTVHDEARLCWQRGWSPIPLLPRSKIPNLPKGHTLLDRKATVEELRSWRWSEGNLGVVTGAISGVTVLDVDGEEGYDTLTDYDSSTFLTPQVETGKGIHYYFAYNSEVDTSVKRLPGLDIRNDGGYVVGPSSIHESGARYSWVSEMSPEDIPLANVPRWLLKAQSRGSQSITEPIGDGRRNWTLLSLAGTLFRRGLPYGVVETAVKEVNDIHCEPPIGGEELERVCYNAFKYENEKQSEGRD